MKKLLSLLLLLNSCAISRPVSDIYKEAHSAVHQITTEDLLEEMHSCTSFHVGNGFIVTAAHCIVDGLPPMLLLKEGNVETTIKKIDKNRDVAILWSEALVDTEFLRFPDYEPTVGERLITVGYPSYLKFVSVKGIHYFKQSVDVGYLLYTDKIDTTECLFTDGNIFKGESGGPLLDEKGFVVGLASRFNARQFDFTDSIHYHKNTGLAISSKEIFKVLLEATDGRNPATSSFWKNL